MEATHFLPYYPAPISKTLTKFHLVYLKELFNVLGPLGRNEAVNSNGAAPQHKKQSRGLLRSLLCCWNASRNSGQGNGNGNGKNSGTGVNGSNVDGRTSPALCPGSPRYLLPAVRHQDMHKKCMVIDLDETLVHSSFKVGVQYYLYIYSSILVLLKDKNMWHGY